MSLSTNTTYRVLVEKLGAANPSQFVGNEGELFYDPSVPSIYLSDGSTAGGVEIAGGGGGSQWTTTGNGIYYDGGNLSIGTNVVGSGSTVLFVEGDARITGILTIGTASITLDPNTNTIVADSFVVSDSSINGGSPLVSVDSATYRGFSAFVNRFWGDDPSINQIVIYKSFWEDGYNSDYETRPICWNSTTDTDSDDFGVGGLLHSPYVCFVNVYGAYQEPNENMDKSPIAIADLQKFVKKFVDKVFYTTDSYFVDDIEVAVQNFYDNIEELKATLPPLYENFEFNLGDDTNYIDDGGNDQYDSGNYINSRDLSGNNNEDIPYGDGTNVLNDYFGSGSHHKTFYQDSIWGMMIYDAQVDSVWYSGGIGADGYGNKQSEVLIGSSENTIYPRYAANKVYSNNYTLTLSDAGRFIYAYDNFLTIPYNADAPFPVGTEIKIITRNLASMIQVNGGSTSLYVNGSDSGGSYSIPKRSIASLVKVEEELWNLEVINDTFRYCCYNNITTNSHPNIIGFYATHNFFAGYYAGRYNTTGGYNNFLGYFAGYNNTTGNKNNFFGSGAGYNNTIGCFNNFLGGGSGYSNIDGCDNNFFGNFAGYSNTSGSDNFFAGKCAGFSNTSGCRNIFVGCSAGTFNTTGSHNNFLGHRTGIYNTTGSYNNFFGLQAGRCNTTGNHNNFFGNAAGIFNDTGCHNFIVGCDAGQFNTTGSFNNFFGPRAGSNNSEGCYNNFFGRYAGYNSCNSCHNIFIGRSAGYQTTGNNNFFAGKYVGYSNTLGTSNFIVGYEAGRYNSTGCFNNFFGPRAGYYNTCGNNNTFIGAYAGYDNTEGSSNNFFGYFAGRNNTTGNHNTFIGLNAGYSNVTGCYNNFIGLCAGYNNTFGCYNNFFGSCAGYSNTVGLYNNFFGDETGRFNQTGCHNNFFGKHAGYNNISGSNNAFFGYQSGFSNTTGDSNVFIGWNAGLCNTIGSSNNFLGNESGANTDTGNYNNFFGKRSGLSNVSGYSNNFFGSFVGISTSASNKVIIGSGYDASNLFDSVDTDKDMQFAVGLRTDTNDSKYWIVGNENFDVGIGTTNPTSKLQVGGDVKVGIDTSQGVILTDENGVAWRLYVNTNGTLGTSLVV